MFGKRITIISISIAFAILCYCSIAFAEIFCTSCGKKNTDTSKFCFSCGSALQSRGISSKDLNPGSYIILKNFSDTERLTKSEKIQLVDMNKSAYSEIRQVLNIGMNYSFSPSSFEVAKKIKDWSRNNFEINSILPFVSVLQIGNYFLFPLQEITIGASGNLKFTRFNNSSGSSELRVREENRAQSLFFSIDNDTKKILINADINGTDNSKVKNNLAAQKTTSVLANWCINDAWGDRHYVDIAFVLKEEGIYCNLKGKELFVEAYLIKHYDKNAGTMWKALGEGNDPGERVFEFKEKIGSFDNHKKIRFICDEDSNNRIIKFIHNYWPYIKIKD